MGRRSAAGRGAEVAGLRCDVLCCARSLHHCWRDQQDKPYHGLTAPLLPRPAPQANLRTLNALAKVLRRRRAERGALSLASPEVKFEIDTETHDPLDVGMYQVGAGVRRCGGGGGGGWVQGGWGEGAGGGCGAGGAGCE